jgi:hypothetical protein
MVKLKPVNAQPVWTQEQIDAVYAAGERLAEKIKPSPLASDAADAQPVAWEACCVGPIYTREVFTTEKEARDCADAWDHCTVTPLFYATTPDRDKWIAEVMALLDEWEIFVDGDGTRPYLNNVRAALLAKLTEGR